MSKCKHENTFFGHIDELVVDFEMCLECGQSRAVYEQESTEWIDNSLGNMTYIVQLKTLIAEAAKEWNQRSDGKLVEQIDQFWDGLCNRWNIESREEIEKDTKESWAEGTSPMNVALHCIWKREPKVEELEAQLKQQQLNNISMQESVAIAGALVDEVEGRLKVHEKFREIPKGLTVSASNPELLKDKNLINACGKDRQAYNSARACEPKQDPELKEFCEWKMVSEYDGVDAEAWETKCEELYYLTDGSPSDNNMKFCPYCGLEIKEVE